MWRAASAPTFASFISSEDLYNRTASLEFYLPRSVETRKCRVPLPCRIDKTNSRNEHTHKYLDIHSRNGSIVFAKMYSRSIGV